MPKDERLWLNLGWMQELRETGRVRVPYRDSSEHPEVGDIVRARAHAERENEAVRTVVVSVEDDDAVTVTLERTD